MKPLLKKIASTLFYNDLFWNLIGSRLQRLFNFGQRARADRASRRLQLLDNALQEIAPDLTVRNGAFKGLKFPAAVAMGSRLFPKLLGSYEYELKGIVEDILKKPYQTIVDVGSAEGFYAVGFALRFPQAKVFAFDVNPAAIAQCQAMAQLNGVADRLETGDFCDPERLMSLSLGSKSLIISDCEGYEFSLFTPEVIRHLEKHDILIEVHDLIDIRISGILKKRFAETHNLEIISSIDDFQKPYRYNFPELEKHTLMEKKYLLEEGRAAAMEWFYLTSKQC